MRKFIFVLVILFVISMASANTIINLDPNSNFSYTRVMGIRELEEGGEYDGVIADLSVEVRPGSGQVYIDTLPLTKIDTQASARLAQEVACEILNKDCSKLDFLYTIRSSYVMLGGPSAGAALTSATMAALQDEEMNNDVLITGTINPAGSIGAVGGIYEKVKAAQKEDINIVLIPRGQEMIDLDEENKTINIIAKAKKDWDIQVIPVQDITDAYKYLTGNKIIRPNITSEEIASEKLDNALKSLSDGLIPEAEKSYEDVKKSFNILTISEKDQIESSIEKAGDELEKAKETLEDESYYSASSFAVRSTIHSYYAEKLIEYYESENETEYVEKEMDRVGNAIADFEMQFLRNKTIDTFDDVEVFSVVIDRIRESEDILEEARDAYNRSDFQTAIYLTAYAEVRKNTAYEWLTLTNEFTGNKSFVFDQSKVQKLALERLEQSRNAIVYSQIISGSALVENSKELLQDAENAYNTKKYVFSVFEASKSRAIANLALEMRSISNETVNSKIKELEKEAQLSIHEAQKLGLTPILALSYLEFAKNFYEDDPAQALIYLSYSKEMAQISEEVTKAVLGDEFIQEENPKVDKYYEEIVRIDAKGSLLEALTILSTGLAAGALITIVYLERKERK